MKKSILSACAAIFLLCACGSGSEVPVQSLPEQAPDVSGNEIQTVTDITGVYENNIAINKGITLSQVAVLEEMDEELKSAVEEVLISSSDYLMSYKYCFDPDGTIYVFPDGGLLDNSENAFKQEIISNARLVTDWYEDLTADEIISKINELEDKYFVTPDNYKGTYTIDQDGKVFSELFSGYFIACDDGTINYVPGSGMNSLDRTYSALGISTLNLTAFKTSESADELLSAVSGGWKEENGTFSPASQDNVVSGYELSDEPITLSGKKGEKIWFELSDEIDSVWYEDSYDHSQADAPYSLFYSGQYLVIEFTNEFSDGQIRVNDTEVNIKTE